ncbi:hypothetical protein ZWY2020_030073 [Hordeum vulgare]|nr:hypothetical protein ZWY2020_030073 [Hordeum vulgare]
MISQPTAVLCSGCVGNGVGESFGVVLSWRVASFRPPAVTMFSVTKSVDEGTVGVLTEWQQIAALPKTSSSVLVRSRRQTSGPCTWGVGPHCRDARRFSSFGLN